MDARIEVLVVEDNPADADLVIELLEEQTHSRFRVETARSTSEALAWLAGRQPDALLLDLGLPDSQGLEGFERVRAAAPGVPILILTGLRDEETAALAARTGAQDFLTKGRFEGETLARAIRYAIERKRLEEERFRLQTEALMARRMQSLGLVTGRFVSELNNLLLGVKGHGDLALAEEDMAPELRRRIEDMARAARRAASLSQEMLACSDGGSFAPEPLDLSALVKQMSHLLEVTAPKGLELHYKLDAELPPVEADAHQMRQMVLQLSLYAASLTAQDGQVRFATGVRALDSASLEEVFGGEQMHSGDHVYLKVETDGVEVEEGALKKLFDPRGVPGSGAGLGVTVAFGIVQNHRGGMLATSTQGGETRLWVFLPLALVSPRDGGIRRP